MQLLMLLLRLSLQTDVAAINGTTMKKFLHSIKLKFKKHSLLLVIFPLPLEFRPSASLLLQGWGWYTEQWAAVFSISIRGGGALPPTKIQKVGNFSNIGRRIRCEVLFH